MANDIYQFTDQIIASLERGVLPWRSSVSGGTAAMRRPLRHNGESYKGINVLILWMQGRSNPHWMTFKQALELGGAVRKGEKGTGIIFYKPLLVTDRVTEEEKQIPMAKRFVVFNAEQIDGLPARYFPAPLEAVVPSAERIVRIDDFFAATGIPLTYGGTVPAYMPQPDTVRMPGFGRYSNAEAFYADESHEFIHATGHVSRLDRDLKGKRWADKQSYGIEELVAELGAAFLMADLGIATPVTLESHASYLQGWLDMMKQDAKAIFGVTALAEKAVTWLHDAVKAGTSVELAMAT